MKRRHSVTLATNLYFKFFGKLSVKVTLMTRVTDRYRILTDRIDNDMCTPEREFRTSAYVYRPADRVDRDRLDGCYSRRWVTTTHVTDVK